MVKKIVKYSKFILCIALILSLVAPTYAALSASDGSAFVTKAEFDSALADFNARLTTFEAGINSKIDSQVTSYLDRNGIWNGKEQDYYDGIIDNGMWITDLMEETPEKAYIYWNDGSTARSVQKWVIKIPAGSKIYSHDAVQKISKSGLAYFNGYFTFVNYAFPDPNGAYGNSRNMWDPNFIGRGSTVPNFTTDEYVKMWSAGNLAQRWRMATTRVAREALTMENSNGNRGWHGLYLVEFENDNSWRQFSYNVNFGMKVGSEKKFQMTAWQYNYDSMQAPSYPTNSLDWGSNMYGTNPLAPTDAASYFTGFFFVSKDDKLDFYTERVVSGRNVDKNWGWGCGADSTDPTGIDFPSAVLWFCVQPKTLTVY